MPCCFCIVSQVSEYTFFPSCTLLAVKGQTEYIRWRKGRIGIEWRLTQTHDQIWLQSLKYLGAKQYRPNLALLESATGVRPDPANSIIFSEAHACEPIWGRDKRNEKGLRSTYLRHMWRFANSPHCKLVDSKHCWWCHMGLAGTVGQMEGSLQ